MGWRSAVEFYRAEMGERHHRRDPLMRTFRYTQTGLAPDYEPDPGLGSLQALLEAAAPAYRECLWGRHDERNRQWIERIAALVTEHGPALETELARLYQAEWPRGNTVDVVSYSDYAGMNTAAGRHFPPHTKMSSSQKEIEGFKGLEMVLHEASHRIFGFRWGTVTQQLMAVSEDLGVPVPRELWHALSFYTSGVVVTRAARAAGEPGFEPYAKRTDMWAWAYPDYLEPIERHWQPYLDGEADLASALADLVRATTERTKSED